MKLWSVKELSINNKPVSELKHNNKIIWQRGRDKPPEPLFIKCTTNLDPKDPWTPDEDLEVTFTCLNPDMTGEISLWLDNEKMTYTESRPEGRLTISGTQILNKRSIGQHHVSLQYSGDSVYKPYTVIIGDYNFTKSEIDTGLTKVKLTRKLGQSYLITVTLSDTKRRLQVNGSVDVYFQSDGGPRGRVILSIYNGEGSGTLTLNHSQIYHFELIYSGSELFNPSTAFKGDIRA